MVIPPVESVAAVDTWTMPLSSPQLTLAIAIVTAPATALPVSSTTSTATTAALLSAALQTASLTPGVADLTTPIATTGPVPPTITIAIMATTAAIVALVENQRNYGSNCNGN